MTDRPLLSRVRALRPHVPSTARFPATGRFPARPRIAALGDLVLDVAVLAREPLASGSDTPGLVRFRAGGSAANTARWVALAGGHATFIGAVGRDGWGRRLVASLASSGVIVRPVRVAAPTARLIALVEPGGERSFLTERGAADLLAPAAVRSSWLRGVAVLHLPGYSLINEPLWSAALRATELVRARGGGVSVDLASRQPLLALGRRESHRRVASVAPDILFANRGEAEALAGKDGTRALLDLAPLVVIKEGPSGCRILLRRVDDTSLPLEIAVATEPLVAADTTGAGDAFDAGFLLIWARAPRTRRNGPALLHRAALSGHRLAARLLSEPRPELEV